MFGKRKIPPNYTPTPSPNGSTKEKSSLPNGSKKEKSSLLTEGSMKADNTVSPLASAKKKEIKAAAIRILTSKSLNCFSTNFQKGVPAIDNNNNNINITYQKIIVPINKHNA